MPGPGGRRAAVAASQHRPAMSSLDPDLLRWAVRAADPGAEVAEVRRARRRLALAAAAGPGGRTRDVVLRVGDADDLPGLRTEVAALTLAADHGLPAPRLLAAELAGERPAVLVEQLAGTSAIPPERPPARLRALGRGRPAPGRAGARPGAALADRPIAVEDFAALRRRQPRPLLLAAEEQVAQRAAAPSAAAGVFVHGDLWQGNALWSGDTLGGGGARGGGGPPPGG